MSPTVQVLFWWLAFAGTHTLLSHPPVRSALVGRLGVGPFQGVYSLLAFSTFVPLVWTFFGNRDSHAMPLSALVAMPGIWWLTMLFMLAAVVLLVLGFTQPNPVSSLTARKGSGAAGVLRITRHPAFMATAIFGLAHLLVNYDALDRAFFGGMVSYSLLGSWHQDWRKRLHANEEVQRFFAETSFFPFVAIASGRNRFEPRELSPAGLVGAAILFLVIFTYHHRFFG